MVRSMSIRFRVPDELAEHLRMRASREGVASSVAMALKILQEQVNADLPPGERPAFHQFDIPHAGATR
jgi:plasmid stability protein